MADQPLDHITAQQVVGVAVQAAHRGQLIVGQAVLVAGQVDIVLAVQRTYLADGGNAQANDIAVPMGGVALEVALQEAVFLGHGQLVVGQGEVVETHIAIAGGGQLLDGVVQHVQLLIRAGQLLGQDAPLAGMAFRPMQVVVERNALRLQVDDGLHRAGKALEGLSGQAVDQIDVDRAVLQRARGIHQGAGLLQALQAVDGALHVRVECLHAEADPVEAQFAQQAHGRPVGLARVDLDAVIPGVVIEQIEVRPQGLHQLAQFGVIEKGGRAATEMQLFHLLVGAQVAGEQGDFPLQMLQVGLRAAAVLGHHLGARAVVAGVGAERDVHIQREGAAFAPAGAQGMQQVERADSGMELRHRGVRRVARASLVVAANQFGIPADGVEHRTSQRVFSGGESRWGGRGAL